MSSSACKSSGRSSTSIDLTCRRLSSNGGDSAWPVAGVDVASIHDVLTRDWHTRYDETATVLSRDSQLRQNERNPIGIEFRCDERFATEYQPKRNLIGSLDADVVFTTVTGRDPPLSLPLDHYGAGCLPASRPRVRGLRVPARGGRDSPSVGYFHAY